jgi:signal transduction histidine kinase
MKKKRLVKLLALSLIIIGFDIKSQVIRVSDKIDSLKQVVAIQEDGFEKADNLLNLSKSYYGIYLMDSAEAYTQKALALSTALKYPQGVAEAYYRQSLILNRKGDYNSARNQVVRFLNIADSLQDSLKLAKGYWLHGTLIREVGDFPNAINNYLISLQIYKSLNDSSHMLSVYHSLGNVFLDNSEFDSAAYYYHKTIEFCEATGNEKGLAIALNQLGKTYSLFPHPQFEEARKYLHMSLTINNKYKRIHSIALNYTNLGNLASINDEVDTALHYYMKAQELNKQTGNIHGLTNNYNNIAEIYEKQGRYSQALENYNKALTYYREQNLIKGITVSLLNIADIFSDQEKYSLAHAYYDSSLRMAEEAGYRYYQKNILRNKSHAYYTEGNHQEAYDYLVRYYDLVDSIFNLETAANIADLKLKYEKKKDQARILTLENENLGKDLILRKRTNQRNVYLFAGSGIIVIIFFLFVFYRHKARKDKIIAEQKIKQLEEEKKLLAAKFLVEGQEEERKRIAKELHDGLGVLLSTTKMQFTTIKDKSPENKPLIDKATKLLEQAAGDVRRISHNMMPGLLTKFGLYEATEDLFDKLNETEGLSASIEITGDIKRLPENTEIMLYRIIQELVNNTIKHAEATTISLKMDILPELLKINYSDDGKGFNVEDKLESKSIGLSSIQSRVNFLSGNVAINSEPGQGVNFTIHIPIV